ncbi:MAG: ester cyclase [Chitinophagaceae bacterium]|nr:ester cyclase [Anaerolineae bacterium]
MSYRSRFATTISLVLLALFLGVFGLSNRAAAQDETAEAHKATLQRVIEESFNLGDLSVIDELYAEDYVNHGFGDDLDREQFKAAISMWRSVMPDFTATPEVLIAQDDIAASRLIYRGTFQNTWTMGDLTIEPNEQPVEWPLIILYRFNEDGKIVEEFTTFDQIDLLTQLDASPLPDFLASALDLRESVVAEMSDPLPEVDEETLAAHIADFTLAIEQGINEGDISVFNMVMVEDYRTHEPFGDFTREQFGQAIQGFRDAVPDLHVTIDIVIAEGDWLATRLIYEGTLANPIAAGDITVDEVGSEIRFIINVLVHFNEEGFAIEDYKEYNRLNWLRQVGLIPAA